MSSSRTDSELEKLLFFSASLWTERMRIAGVPSDIAYEIALLGKKYRYKYKEINDIDTVIAWYAGKIRKRELLDQADRFERIVRWLINPEPLTILILGGSGTGKTRLTTEIARVFAVRHHIKTNVIRDVLRKFLSPDLAPVLHTRAYLAWQVLPNNYSARFDEVLVGFLEHAKMVSVGVKAVLRRAINEGVSILVDGVHLHPYVIDSIDQTTNVVSITLEIKDINKHKEYLQGLETSEEDADILRNFNSIRRIHDYLVQESKLRGIPVIEVSDVERSTNTAFRIIGEAIEKVMQKRRDEE